MNTRLVPYKLESIFSVDPSADCIYADYKDEYRITTQKTEKNCLKQTRNKTKQKEPRVVLKQM